MSLVKFSPQAKSANQDHDQLSLNRNRPVPNPNPDDLDLVVRPLIVELAALAVSTEALPRTVKELAFERLYIIGGILNILTLSTNIPVNRDYIKLAIRGSIYHQHQPFLLREDFIDRFVQAMDHGVNNKFPVRARMIEHLTYISRYGRQASSPTSQSRSSASTLSSKLEDLLLSPLNWLSHQS
jgi:hypothetical protein